MYSLDILGWTASLQSALDTLDPELRPARVAAEDRGLLRLLDDRGAFTGHLPGSFLHRAASRLDLPGVGDWVAVDAQDRVRQLLPRSSAFVRRASGERSEPQLLAANIDVALLVSSANQEFNPRRIERWVTAAWDAGATPVLVLNKVDLNPSASQLTQRLGALASSLPLVQLSALHGQGLEGLAPWLGPGRTLALLGSSGVGKSTLANRLLGREQQDTGGVREDDDAGRHTTVRREVLVLPDERGLLIDTPGLRELQLWWADSEGTGLAYADVEEAAQSCRFRNCKHTGEPGCAVLAAVEQGSIGAGRLRGYRKLLREQAWEERRQDQFSLRAAQRSFSRRVTRATRQRRRLLEQD